MTSETAKRLYGLAQRAWADEVIGDGCERFLEECEEVLASDLGLSDQEREAAYYEVLGATGDA